MNAMNKHFLRAAWSLCAMSFAVVSQAQVSISEVDLIEGCDGVVTDSGGSGAGYGPDETHSVTICPPDGEETVWIEWQIFELDPSSTICVHDGETSAAALLAQGTNDQLDGNTYVAGIGNLSGCLTITFTSGSGADVDGDFAFSINCGQPCAVPVPVLNLDEPSPLRACPNEPIMFDGSMSFSSGTATITEWQWDWTGDGTVDETTAGGVNSHTYVNPGIYRVQMSLVDDAGCESIDLTNYMVHVSNEPVWGIEPLQRTACTGDEVDLEVVVEGQEFVHVPSVDFGGGFFIPGEVGTCFSSEITFTQFMPGQTLVDASSAVEQLFMNFEHSYMGDLVISLTCPNGQSIQVHDQAGAGTYLGEPVDDETDPDTPGVGYDYAWSPDATNGTWGDNAGFGTLPAGTYQSTQPFVNLDGCPLNGVWQIQICDLLGGDNGFVFDWGIQLADSLYPVEQSFTPEFGLECDSTFWTNDNQIDHSILSGQWDCAEVGVTMDAPGPQTYTAHAVNNFGCEFTQEVNVEYLATADSCTDLVLNCSAIGQTFWDDLEIGIYPSSFSGEVGQSMQGEFVYNVPTSLIDSATGNAFLIQGIDEITFTSWPEGIQLITGENALVGAEQVCFEFGGVPVQEGAFEVLASADLSLEVFGATYDYGNIQQTLLIEVSAASTSSAGCTYALADNYLPFATEDDGSCAFFGCMDSSALNFNQFANFDDGSCEFDLAFNLCPSDLNGDGIVGSSDLLELLSDFGVVCPIE